MRRRILSLTYEALGWVAMAAWVHVVYRAVETFIHLQTTSFGLYFYTTVLGYMVAQAASRLTEFLENRILDLSIGL